MNRLIQQETQELMSISHDKKVALKDWLARFGVEDIYRITGEGERSIKGYPCSAFAYAHNAYKIASVLEMKVGIEKMEVHVRNAVRLVISHFVSNYASTGNDEKDTERIRHLANLVIVQYGSRLSLFGLTHALGLLGSYQSPCAENLEFYNPQIVQKALNRYIAHCKDEYERFEKKMFNKVQEERKAPPASPGSVLGFNQSMNELVKQWNSKSKPDESTRSRYEGHPQREWSKSVTPEQIRQSEQAQMEYARKRQTEELGGEAEILDFD